MTDWMERLRAASEKQRAEQACATLREALREILRQHPDGLTVPQLAKLTGRLEGNVYTLLQKKPEFWIDRWERSGGRGAPRAVWMAPPADCPRLDPKPTRKVRKAPRAAA